MPLSFAQSQIIRMDMAGMIDWSLEPLSRDEVAAHLEAQGIKAIFEDAPRNAQSEEHYEAIERRGQRYFVTAKAIREGRI